MHNLLKESSTGLWFFGKNKQLRKFWIDLSFFYSNYQNIYLPVIFLFMLFWMYVNQYIFYQCALTDDGVLLYVSLALSCMPNALFSPLGARPPVPIVFRWSPTFTGCFDPNPWHPPVGGSAVVASPLLVRSRLPARIVSAVPDPAGWPFCCFSQSSLLSCVFFLTSLVMWAASTRIALGTLCSRPLQENNHTLNTLSLQSAIRSASSHVPLHSSLPMARSALSLPTSSTAGTLAQRLI